MAKAIIITLVLLAIIVVLLFVAVQQPQIVYTQPTEKPAVIPEQPTPTAPIIHEEPTPRAEVKEPTVAGVEFDKVYPQDVNFWVNEILVPKTSLYEGQQFIPIKEGDIKTFAGSFGPYYYDPSDHIKIKLCAQLKNYEVGETCEIVPFSFREKYVTFVKGYQHDEFIAGFAAKDYKVWYDVFVGDTRIAASNVAIVRTVRD